MKKLKIWERSLYCTDGLYYYNRRKLKKIIRNSKKVLDINSRCVFYISSYSSMLEFSYIKFTKEDSIKNIGIPFLFKLHNKKI